MRVRMYHSGDGDCLLLTATSTDASDVEVEHHVLVDGGRKGTFRDNARKDLYSLGELELVCVSHIDEDHIAGVLAMIEDAVEWRVHRRREATGQPTKKPRFPEPPTIQEIWHNSLFELVGDEDELDVQVESSLASSAGLLAGSTDQDVRGLATRMDNLATGEKSSLELSRRISDRQLGIKRNRPRNKLMLAGDVSSRSVGSMTMKILGPTQESVEKLRGVWQKWIDAETKAVNTLRRELLEDEAKLGSVASSAVTRSSIATALGQGSITEPNLASLMLLATGPGGGTILLTGDGSSEDILAGLAHHGLLDEGRFHVNALKVQHHGASANVTPEFVSSVTADHYLFCGNGNHHNPEIEVVEAFARARIGQDAVGPSAPFKFWFSSRHDSDGLIDKDGTPSNRSKHMKQLEDLVGEIAADANCSGDFSFEFLRSGHLDIII